MTGKPPEIVSYSTFVRDLADAKVSGVDVYDFGAEIDLTYSTSDGEFRAAKGPIGLDDDELLLFNLKSQGVPFTVHGEEYDGPGASGVWLSQILSFAFLLVPVLLILVILRQSKTIRTLAEALARHTRHPEAPSDSRD